MNWVLRMELEVAVLVVVGRTRSFMEYLYHYFREPWV